LKEAISFFIYGLVSAYSSKVSGYKNGFPQHEIGISFIFALANQSTMLMLGPLPMPIASQPSYRYLVGNDKGKSRDGLISIFKMSYDNASLFHCKMRSVGYSTPGQTIRKCITRSTSGIRRILAKQKETNLCEDESIFNRFRSTDISHISFRVS